MRAAWIAAALLPLLGGCGFTPLYAETGVAPALKAVAIDTADHSRTAYFLRQQLDDELGRDRGAAAQYRLAVQVGENRFPLGVRVNNVASRYEIALTVFWQLFDISSGAELTKGVTPVRISYASADPPYAGVTAFQDGTERASREAAARVRQEVARWLAAHPRAASPRSGD